MRGTTARVVRCHRDPRPVPSMADPDGHGWVIDGTGIGARVRMHASLAVAPHAADPSLAPRST